MPIKQYVASMKLAKKFYSLNSSFSIGKLLCLMRNDKMKKLLKILATYNKDLVLHKFLD